MTTLGDSIIARGSWDATAAALANYASIRRGERRAYAEHYAGHLLGMATAPDPYTYGLNYRDMARMRRDLDGIASKAVRA